MSTSEYDSFTRGYLKLALEIDRNLEGYVDAYYGPKEIQQEVESGDPLTPLQLQEDHQQLQDLLPEDRSQRGSYLAAQLDAMGFMIRKLAGEEFTFLDEVEGLYGIRPELVPEEEFLEIHKKLDEYLPGKGSLAERVIKRTEELKTPAELMPSVVKAILEQIRTRTNQLLSLVPGENFEVGYVHNKPWRAYNYYLGDFQSKIEFNLDWDWNPALLTNTLCHEAYPGHHTEQQKKEQLLYRDQGMLEETCRIIFSPWAVITEGIADTALEAIDPELDIYHWLVDELTPELNLPPASWEELYWQYVSSGKILQARSNAAILYHQGELSKEDVHEYLQTYMLINRKTAEMIFERINDPFWKTYLFTYTEGYQLIKQVASGENLLPFFKRLLTEQLLPEDLRNMA